MLNSVEAAISVANRMSKVEVQIWLDACLSGHYGSGHYRVPAPVDVSRQGKGIGDGRIKGQYGNPHAGLALCQEIAWKSRQFEQSVTIAQSSEHLFMAYLINHVMDEMFYMVYVAQGNTPALALSRLALAALRTQGGDDDPAP